MSVPWWDLRRQNTVSGWGCTPQEAAGKCPPGYRADPNQVSDWDKYCRMTCGDSRCPQSCKSDILNGFFGCTPLYDRAQVRCIKSSYSSDDISRSKCCSGTTAAENCEYDYYKGSIPCDNFMQNFCAKDNNMFTNRECKTWCNNNSKLCDNVKKSACVGENLSNVECDSWCARNPQDCAANFKSYCTKPEQFKENSYCAKQSMTKGFEVDTLVKQFCVDHQDSDFCSCYKSLNESDNSAAKNDPTLAAILSRPECYVSRCSSGGGYQTTNMRNNLMVGTCPPVQVCQNTLNALGNTSTGLKNISQKCDQATTTTSSTVKSDNTLQTEKTVSIPPPQPPTQQSIREDNDSFLSNPVYQFIIGLVGFILLILVVKSSSNPPPAMLYTPNNVPIV